MLKQQNAAHKIGYICSECRPKLIAIRQQKRKRHSTISKYAAFEGGGMSAAKASKQPKPKYRVAYSSAGRMLYTGKGR